mgnify:CR=1 FL=1
MPSLKYYHSIKIDGREIGKIQIVDYQVPHIEYDLDPAWHNRGIMTRELTTYLAKIRNTYPNLMAVVEKDNKASIRVLEKVGFVKFKPTKHYLIYLWTSDNKKREALKFLIEQSLDSVGLGHVK